MDLNQDENASEGKYSTKRDPTNISKVQKEWTYNVIYLTSPKSKDRKSQKDPKKFSKWRQLLTTKSLWRKSHDWRQILVFDLGLLPCLVR